MKKQIMALLLAVTLILQSIGTVPVFANVGAPTNTSPMSAIALEKGVGQEMTVTGMPSWMGGYMLYYSFTPSETKTYEFYSDGTTDTAATLYTAEGYWIADDDQSGGNNNFLISATLEAGSTYIIEVSAFEDGVSTLYVNEPAFYANAVQERALVAIGDSVTLEVAVGGAVIEATGATYKLAYQWMAYNNDTWSYEAIQDATAAAYTIAGATADMAKQYRCVVECTYGDTPVVKSTNVQFYVTPMNLYADALTKENPAELTYDAQTQEYYVAFTPAADGIYDFYTKGALATSATIYDAAENELGFAYDGGEGSNFYTSCELKEGKTYYVKVSAYVECKGTCEAECTCTETATLYVDALTFSAEAVSSYVSADMNSSATFEVNATPHKDQTVELHYDWYAITGEGDVVQMASHAAYTVDVVNGIAEEYRCTVTDTISGNTKDVYFHLKISTYLAAEGNTQRAYANVGDNVTLSIVSADSLLADNITYQWKYRDDSTYDYVNITGATADTYTFAAEATKSAYCCDVTDGYETVSVYYNIYSKDAVNEFVFGDAIGLEEELAYSGDLKCYTFVPTADGTYKFYTDGEGAAVLYLYDAQFNLIGVEENSAQSAEISLSKAMKKGEVYYVEAGLVHKWYGQPVAPTTIKASVSNCDIANADVTVAYATTSYDGTAKKPVVTVKFGNYTLVEGTDYTVAITNNTNPGTATVTVTGKGGFKGSVTETFTITKTAITSATLSYASTTYNGKAQTPVITVKAGNKVLSASDYDVKVVNNVNVGTATVTITGKGGYSGTITKTFTISAAKITDATLSYASTAYNGKAQTPVVTVKVGNTVIAAANYDVKVVNNTNPGTATVTITAKGNYTGTITKTFTITKASVAKATVTLKTNSYNYDGKAKKPAVKSVVLNGVTLKEGTDYTVKYSSNKNIGTAKVTITGKGNYEGSVVKTFTIKAKNGTTFKSGAYKYKVTGASTVAFAGINKDTTKKVTIAATVKYGNKTFKVTSIADNALKGKKKVTQVTIGKNVTTIGKSAFENCTKLSKVTIGANVTTISDKAFKKCTSLKSITIPSKVKKIGKEVFSGDKKLKTITIKSTKLTSVGKNAFKGIDSKATIKVPSKKLKAYQKLLKNKGQGKKVKIKK